MWITVEKALVSGDSSLGISKLEIKGYLKFSTFPQSPTQAFKFVNLINLGATWKKLCNYRTVISLTHFFTLVTTTNFKYKSLFQNVLVFKLFLKPVLKPIMKPDEASL